MKNTCRHVFSCQNTPEKAGFSHGGFTVAAQPYSRLEMKGT